jgi:hypothetical protein
MTSKQLREEARAWARDMLSDSLHEFRSCRFSRKLLRITEATGAWSGFYAPDPDSSKLILKQFVFGNSPGIVYTPVHVLYQVLRHFEIEED